MNTNWYAVVSFPLEKDLLPFLSWLEQQGITHYVTEEEGQQQLWIGEQHRVAEVAQSVKRWNAGSLDLGASDSNVQPPGSDSHRQSYHALPMGYLLHCLPVSVLIILLGLLGTVLVNVDTHELTYTQIFLFQPVVNGTFAPLSATMASGQYWRLLTPVFLHFGFFHILFNGVILWAMGTLIERVKGSFHYLLLIIIVGVMSNIAQYLSQPDAIFGGLSGVVYGVIGYIAVYQQVIPRSPLQFNPAMIIFFIAWLLIGFTGVIDWFIPGKVANMSHLGGLISGAVIGYLIASKDKDQRAHKN